ncbi:MAG: 4-(cytidine 5'-diphospho)-2-C-methyl-D-erythritol kinase [Phenylobacterium sp. RIFCSPHIGHO2_01_FULL_69_31]|jgi:4-diphosphocytidyl-2-C-methyl-D-erythritol kinase|uniref:4-(cytidine 5'-diphospho)-2-C-methyl-D-erythritol kinase n=1 Tax=Phenylobacterium sp. RIFCSPHIGHO2_01_FULL_69_31 TaxID=1801944 RepID=UPI0008B5E561|nr:4-(cytidine 5'-diphospho)-2-C-methyl-D-erythritol kinase [Phenylobacterium sp. RIFCSPHIGHO2_01_FULL_69_31]OHB30377.1 MAG: 4-(cytidine 5'-diphospho)-2-C-methyl-D-erythritol kinase [Phenylobacterium sp. RIFCSPHIGHO2_01_FULL_69_31]
MPARLAPAKVNLFLHVGAPTADGYHPICSLMVFADVGDRVSMELGEGRLTASGPFAGGLGRESDNLIIRAVRAFVADLGRPMAELSFGLDKRLPIASGLGGGSSDAGAALRLIRDVFAPQVDDARLEAVAARLGADGAACLWGRPVLAQGRGERLTPAPGLPVLHAVLVNPGVPVSTPEVYRRLDAAGAFGDVTPPVMPDAFESPQEVAAWLATQGNDLEAPAVAAAPEIGTVLDTLRDEPEVLLARVSGSGGTCFALCGDDIAAETLAERIEAMAPHWWVERCRLGGPWE